jgi:hypothetical protein
MNIHCLRSQQSMFKTFFFYQSKTYNRVTLQYTNHTTTTALYQKSTAIILSRHYDLPHPHSHIHRHRQCPVHGQHCANSTNPTEATDLAAHRYCVAHLLRRCYSGFVLLALGMQVPCAEEER